MCSNQDGLATECSVVKSTRDRIPYESYSQAAESQPSEAARN